MNEDTKILFNIIKDNYSLLKGHDNFERAIHEYFCYKLESDFSECDSNKNFDWMSFLHYTSNKAVLCKTEYKANNFLNYLDKLGYKWWYGGEPSLIRRNYFKEGGTLYFIADGFYRRTSNIVKDSFHVIQCRDYEQGKYMSKRILDWDNYS